MSRTANSSISNVSTEHFVRPRNHNRARSSDGITIPTLPGPAPPSVPRRKGKVFAFTAVESAPPPQRRSKRLSDDEDDLITPTRTPRSDSVPTVLSYPNQDIPLVPIPFRPGHSKASSDFVGTPTYGDELRASFPVRRTAMVRKKSGELVRSSLKFGEMTRIEAPSPKSEPATPTFTKMVHFDTQLEHVKLFLTQQKPAAVSRSGSPTLETETEDEPESFPFPAMSTSGPGLLSLELPNFPTPLNLDQDVLLEEIEIGSDGKSLRGVVRVKNLAFDKWIAVRYSLDNWSSLLEVSAEHLQSFSATVDRFVFSIRLQDVLSRIDEKTMLLAIRYTVGGREIWDNNGGEDYQLKFVKAAPTPPPAPVANASWTNKTASESKERMAADLKRELARLVDDDERNPSRRAETRSFTEGAFTSRYDFGSSFKATSPSTFRSNPSAQLPLNLNPTFEQPGETRSPQRASPNVGGRSPLPTNFGAYTSLYSGSTIVSEVEANYYASYSSEPAREYNSNNVHNSQRGSVSSTTSSTSSRASLNDPPYAAAPSQLLYSSLDQHSPLVPPTYRDFHRPRYGSPLSSPIVTPGDSPANSSTTSPLSSSPPKSFRTLSSASRFGQGQGVNIDPNMFTEPSLPTRIESQFDQPADLSSFLERYCFHTSLHEAQSREPAVETAASKTPTLDSTPRSHFPFTSSHVTTHIPTPSTTPLAQSIEARVAA